MPYFPKESPGYVNVKDYGAKGNGTTDDTTAITSALAVLTDRGGGTLYFPSGTYVTSGGFTISVPCTLRGDGSEAFDGSEIITRITCTSSTAVLFTVASDYATFQDIALACTHASPSAGSAVFVSSSYIHQACNFAGVVIRGFYDNIDYQVSAQWTLSNSYILDPVRYGVRIRNTVNQDAGDWGIVNTNFNTLTRNATSAIRLESSGGGKITNCKFNMSAPPNTFYFTDMINMEKSLGDSTSILLISNCSLENYSGDAIDLTGPNWNMIQINNCQFGQYSNSTGVAIRVNTLNDLLINNCHFRNSSNSSSAISLTSVNRARIYAVTNNGFSSLLSQSGCTDVVNMATYPSAVDVGAAASSHTHAASDVVSGTVATARLGSGTADNTTFLRGDSTWQSVAGGAPVDATYVTTSSNSTLSNEIAIHGLAGNADRNGVGGGSITEEYNTSTTRLTWTSSDPTTVNSNTTVPSWLYCAWSDNIERIGLRAWAPGSGAFDARSKVGIGSGSNSVDAAIGLIITDSGNSNRLLIQIGSDSTNKRANVSAFTYASSAYTQRGSAWMLTGQDIYLRIRRDGSNNCSFWYSSDGLFWQLIATQAFTLTVANIGYRLSATGSADWFAGSDWLRASV